MCGHHYGQSRVLPTPTHQIFTARKLGRSLAYLLKPTHVYITVADRQYRISVSRKQLSDLFVVLAIETGGKHYKFTKNIKNKPKVISVCANLWNILFQRNVAPLGTKIISHEKPTQH